MENEETKMTEQDCRYCGGQLEERRVTRFQEYQGHWVVIENVPALVCQQCGEIYFTPQAHDLVVEYITGQHKPVRVESVEVYDAAQ